MRLKCENATRVVAFLAPDSIPRAKAGIGPSSMLSKGMDKAVTSSAGEIAQHVEGASTNVRNSKTGQFITVRGVGALKDSGLKIKKGISLTKPIAKQVLAERTAKRKTG